MTDDQLKILGKIGGAAALLLYAISGISLLQVRQLLVEYILQIRYTMN